MSASPVSGFGYRHILAVREFRWLFAASVQSLIGDQLARVALSVLVYERTRSGLATAVVYALTFLPEMVGGLLLSGLADRMPRRTVMIACDVLRALLLAVMAIPGMPLVALAALLFVAVLAGSPFKAGEPALVADLFSGPTYTTAIGLRFATSQTAQLLGFAAGGALLTVLSPSGALLVDAATFAVSALLLAIGLVDRPAPAPKARHTEQLRVSLRLLIGHRRLRSLLALACLSGLWVVPEGLAAPYAASLGGGPGLVGVLLAAGAGGNVVGSVLVSRFVPPAAREGAVVPMGLLAGIALVACAAEPGQTVTVALLFLSGVGSGYLVQVMGEFTQLVPVQMRAQVIGIASASLLSSQGIGLLLGGALAEVVAVTSAVAVAGATGSVLLLLVERVRRL